MSVRDAAGQRSGEVVHLARELVRIPSVTNCERERLDELRRCAGLIGAILEEAHLELLRFSDGKYPALLAGFPGALTAPVTLVGHFDVVQPEPDDSQFVPRVDGDYLWGRGAADMKTVVASFVVWMTHRVRRGPPYPPLNLLLVGNEENGEAEAWGTPHVLGAMVRDRAWSPELMIVGERTGEQGDELFGRVCSASRGVVRLRVMARGVRGHTGVATAPHDLLDLLVEARLRVRQAMERHLTLASDDGWASGARFPFLNVGEPGVYNITAAEGNLGIEMRPIPEDDTEALVLEIIEIAEHLGLACAVDVHEEGVVCPATNPYLGRLVQSVEAVSGTPVVLGRKLPGSSARFAPGGHQVVWGQTGIGPHSAEERHFIPSIEPYLRVLDHFADTLQPV